MKRYTEKSLISLYEANLRRAKRLLMSLRVASASVPKFSGLSGWVFEQTVGYCLRAELRGRSRPLVVEDQIPLGGRASADIRIGSVVVEIKNAGLFGEDDALRYRRHRQLAEARGFAYAFLTQYEGHIPSRRAIKKTLGKDSCFFLDTAGDGRRFVAFVKARAPEEGATRIGKQR